MCAIKRTEQTSIFKNEVGIQAIKIVKQEMNDGITAQLVGKIPTWHSTK